MISRIPNPSRIITEKFGGGKLTEPAVFGIKLGNSRKRGDRIKDRRKDD
jgi:hypothetical protein